MRPLTGYKISSLSTSNYITSFTRSKWSSCKLCYANFTSSSIFAPSLRDVQAVPRGGKEVSDMTYEEIITKYAVKEMTYEDALNEMFKRYSEQVEECPWDITKEELIKLMSARGLLEEVRFNKMYKD